MTAEQLLAGMGHWVTRIGGKVNAPKELTCRSRNGGRTIDYAIFDERISSAVVSTWVDFGCTSNPHKAVRHRLRASGSRDQVRQLRKPKAFPLWKPMGCPRAPRVPRPEVVEVLKKEDVTMKEVSHAFEHLMELAEEELCGLCDMVEEDGASCKKCTGRSRPKFEWGATVPTRGKEVGRADPATLGLQWLGRAFLDMAGILRLVHRGAPATGAAATARPLTDALARQWAALQSQLTNTKTTVQAAMRDASPVWRWRVSAATLITATTDTSVDAARVLQEWGKEACQEAKERGDLAGKEASESWGKWTEKQLSCGAPALHRLAKRVDLPSQDAVQSSHGDPTLKQQDIVDKEAADWKEIWDTHKGTASAPWRGLGNLSSKFPWAAELPALTGKDLRKVGSQLSRNTGLGIDQFNPRWFVWLSDDLLDSFALLLMALERLGLWPEQIDQILIALIPKPDGGRRPVGLLPTLVRMWEKSRRPIVQEWRQKVKRKYNWAAKGRSATDAVWKQAILAEAAVARGKATASVLLDLVKAFELVKLHLVWIAGLKHGFHPVILRLCLEAFSLLRRLVIGGACSEPISTLSAILAGGSFATDCMYIILIDPCDLLLEEHPEAGLCLFVDDITIHEQGDTEMGVATNLQKITDRCVQMLEDDLEGKVSRASKWCIDTKTKTVAIGSSCKVNRALRPRMRALGVKTEGSAKLLGVDYSSGARLRRKVQNKRLKQANAKRTMLRRFGRKAAERIIRTGLGPSIRYGAGVVGASSSTIQGARRLSCAAQSEMRGRSQFARLQLTGYDVGGLMAIDPIVEWAKATWDGLVDRDILKDTWKAAMGKVAMAVRPFQVTIGPAGAMVASALRLGWKVPSPSCLRDQEGRIIDMDKICPIQVQLRAQEALMHKEACESGMARRIGGPPDLEPLRDYIKAGANKGSRAAGSLKALGEGGWWTQARLYEEGVQGVEDPFCRACGPGAPPQSRSSFGPRPGTLYHRCCECPATSGVRRQSKHQEALGKAHSMVHGSSPLYQHGVPLLSMDTTVPEEVIRAAGGRLLPKDFTFTGNVFTDGALRGGGPARARRGGWAAILVIEAGEVTSGLYGTCPEHFPSSQRTELWAILQCLRLAVGPVHIWTDCAGAVEGWLKGKEWATAACRPAADLWRLIWAIIDDLGPELVKFHKVKGHSTQADVEAGRCTQWERICNDHADHFAKRGSSIAEEMAPTEQLRQAYRDARQWYSWLTELLHHWPEDVQKKVGGRVQGQATAKRRGRPKAVARGALTTGVAARGTSDTGATATATTATTDAHTSLVPALVATVAPEAARETPAREVAASGMPDTEMAAREVPATSEPTADAGPQEEMQQATASAPSYSLHPTLPHQLDTQDGVVRCGKCGKGPSGSTTLEQFAKGKCLTLKSKIVAPPVGETVNDDGHELFLSGIVKWCARCGCYGASKPRLLLEGCKGNLSKSVGNLKALKKGVHPLSKDQMGPCRRIRCI